jgi:hypothetical protein
MIRSNHQFDASGDHYVCELDILDRSFLKDLLPFTNTYAYDGELQFF